MTDKELNIKKLIEESPEFEDLPIEEQWDLMRFMLSIVTDPEALEIIEFLLNQLKKALEIIRQVKVLKPSLSFEKGFMEALEKAENIKISPKDIYFIESKEGLIKIGISRTPQKRLKSLQNQTRYKLKLLLIIPNGGREREKDLHDIFHKYRIFGEWFEKSSEIMNYVKKLKKKMGPNQKW